MIVEEGSVVRIVTIRRASTRGVVERWSRQYPADKGVGGHHDTTRKLAAMPLTATPNELAAVIGNKSWTHLSCAGCRDYADVAVQVGDSDGALLCLDCISEMALAAEQIKRPQ